MDGLVGASVDRVLGKGVLDRTSESQQWTRIGRLEVEDLVTEPGSAGKGDLDRPEPCEDCRQGIHVDAGEQFRRFERVGDGDVRSTPTRAAASYRLRCRDTARSAAGTRTSNADSLGTDSGTAPLDHEGNSDAIGFRLGHPHINSSGWPHHQSRPSRRTLRGQARSIANEAPSGIASSSCVWGQRCGRSPLPRHAPARQELGRFMSCLPPQTRSGGRTLGWWPSTR